MAGQFTLGKYERIKGKLNASAVFSKGQTEKKYPILVKIIVEEREGSENESSMIAGFSVPKRNFKKPVDRNRIKRPLKEAYRLNRISLLEKCEEQKINLALFFIYTGKEKVSYHNLEEKIKVILEKVDTAVFKSSKKDYT